MLWLAAWPAGAAFEFELCGPHLPEDDSEEWLTQFAMAPHLGRILILRDAKTITIVEIRGAPCTLLFTGSHQFFVWGNYSAVRCKLRPESAYCIER